MSSDAGAWQRKRDVWRYEPGASDGCTMQCERCEVSHEPTIVFLDVTNRCNMNCPICIANIRGMGFEFHPPLEYFEKVFKALAKLRPIPLVELFGGEPTVRDDLIDIVRIARDHGVKSRVVTNGLRLADEEYCKKLCEIGIRFRLALDGRDPEVYRRLRKNPGAYEKKMRALENLAKYSRRKHAILCCAARKINEDHIADLIECCHEHAEIIDSLGFLPLTEMWDAGTFEIDVPTTREDVEHMVARSVPGGRVEFIPAGIMYGLRTARSFLKPKSSSDALMFGGVHPDCETMTLLTSDGQHYRSISHYLKLPLSRVAEEILARSRKIDRKLSRLDPASRFDRLRGRLAAIKTFGPLALRAIDLKRICRGRPFVVALRMLAGLVKGRSAGDLARRHLNLSRLLRVVVLPFEEYHAIDAARLESCKAVFAYEDVEDGTIRTVPACIWAGVYRNEILRRIAAKYDRNPRLPDAAAPRRAEPDLARPAPLPR